MAVSPSSSDSVDGTLRVALRASVPGAVSPVVPGERIAYVLVEPLYVAPAAALALDAGWGGVELAERSDAAPIPLVSFEQPPVPEHRGATCRLRADVNGIEAALAEIGGDAAADATVLLGAPAFARPLMARLAFAGFDAVELIPIASGRQLAADAWWASGMLMRVLLDELDGRDAVLDDAAGIAVSLVGELGDAAPALGAGRRWDAHLAAGGNVDDLRIACAIDSIGVVPRIDTSSGVATGIVVRPW